MSNIRLKHIIVHEGVTKPERTTKNYRFLSHNSFHVTAHDFVRRHVSLGIIESQQLRIAKTGDWGEWVVCVFAVQWKSQSRTGNHWADIIGVWFCAGVLHCVGNPEREKHGARAALRTALPSSSGPDKAGGNVSCGLRAAESHPLHTMMTGPDRAPQIDNRDQNRAKFRELI
ncbi:hypothetical protein BJV78DRAFT_1315499 [Lactifluus subvellereus]|nr:hypothetical protein BJV78DRAFT_1315499 [Lactifluus subvellereus]